MRFTMQSLSPLRQRAPRGARPQDMLPSMFGSGHTALSVTSLFMYLLRTRQAPRSNLTCVHLCSRLDVSSRYLFLLPNDFASVKPWRWFRDTTSLWDIGLLCQNDRRLSTTTNYLTYNVYAGVVRARTLWRNIAAARGPMHDILPWLLSSPFIAPLSYRLFTIPSSCLLDSFNDGLSITALVTAERDHQTRVSALPRPASSLCSTVHAPRVTMCLFATALLRTSTAAFTCNTPHSIPPPLPLPRFGSNFFCS